MTECVNINDLFRPIQWHLSPKTNCNWFCYTPHYRYIATNGYGDFKVKKTCLTTLETVEINGFKSLKDAKKYCEDDYQKIKDKWIQSIKRGLTGEDND